MKDFRETLIQDVKNQMLMKNYSIEDINQMADILIVQLGKYQVSERATDIAIRDNTTEKMLKLYAGTLLTGGKSKKTVRGYIGVLKRFAGEIPRVNVLEASAFDIRVWLASKQESCTLRTCENYRSYLSAFYQWLFKEDFIEKNPMEKVDPIKYEDEIRKEFSDVDLDSLRSNCVSLRERAELELLVSSGARVSELCSLNREDLDLNNLSVIIRKGKGGKQRITYMSEVCRVHLQKYLDSRADSNPSLFISNRVGRISKGSIELDLKKIGERANIQNVHPHRCRRTFATSLHKKGMDVRTIQQLMGHANINTTMCYISMSDDRIKSEYRRYS